MLFGWQRGNPVNHLCTITCDHRSASETVTIPTAHISSTLSGILVFYLVKTRPWNWPSCAFETEKLSNESPDWGGSALSRVLNIITLHSLLVAFLPCQARKTQTNPETQTSRSGWEKGEGRGKSVPKHNCIPTQPATHWFPESPRASGPPLLCKVGFSRSPNAVGDLDHPLQRLLVANGHHRPGVEPVRSSVLQLAGLLPWQLASRDKRNQHALETVLCQNLQQKYLGSTIINRKYSELFSVAGLQPFYIAGLQPTKAKTQNKNKVRLSNHRGNSAYLLK